MSANKEKNGCLLSIVVPMHNEEEGVDEFFKRMIPILSGISEDWEIVCVNDGSRDRTFSELKKYNQRDGRIKLLNFSRNFGKEAALTAGIDHATGKAVIPIDADLQDPPELIPEMVKKWQSGYKVVLATRRSRAGETMMKKATAALFYKLISKVSSVEIPANTGDFRLMDRQVVDVVKQFSERNRFMKGILAWPGFETTTIYFDRDPRYAGKSSWNFWRLWQFALNGIFGFTSAPLKIWTYLGVVISVLAFLYASFLILRTLIYGVDVPGYASLLSVILFLGGIQLIGMGVMGEYISRIYSESKGRPLYVVSEKLGFD